MVASLTPRRHLAAERRNCLPALVFNLMDTFMGHLHFVLRGNSMALLKAGLAVIFSSTTLLCDIVKHFPAFENPKHCIAR